MSTKKTNTNAFRLLKKNSAPQAAKYHLKQAIIELGHQYTHFEKRIAEILRYQGLQIVQGKCITRERGFEPFSKRIKTRYRKGKIIERRMD